jgi:hypothetical protein
VDREIIADFTGGPDGLAMWLICMRSRLSFDASCVRPIVSGEMSTQ